MDAVTPLTPQQSQEAEQSALADPYALRVLVALDCLGNAVIGGKPDETISTDAGLLDRKHNAIGRIVSHLLNLAQADHGAKAAAGDLARAQAEVGRLSTCGLVGQ